MQFNKETENKFIEKCNGREINEMLSELIDFHTKHYERIENFPVIVRMRKNNELNKNKENNE